MLNQVVLVGRLTKEVEVKELEDGKKVGYINLAIPRSLKNADGEYETDFINCTLWNGVASSVSDYCKKGDIVGVKGRLQSESIDDEDGTKKYVINLIAEKVTFLSSRSDKITEEDK